MGYVNNDTESKFYRAVKEYAHNLTRKQLNDALRVWNAYINGDLKHIDTCYARPSHEKERAYYCLEATAWHKYDYCLGSGIITYNTCTFTWGAIVANKVEDGDYYECFALYATAWRTERIPIGVVQM